MFPLASPRETMRVSGKQNSPFPLGSVIKCLFLSHDHLRINVKNKCEKRNSLFSLGTAIKRPRLRKRDRPWKWGLGKFNETW